MKKLIRLYNNLNVQTRSSLWFLFANIFQKAVMILFTPIFTRVMTTEEFSKYAVFQSWEAIFTVFATLNISSYATAKALVDIKEDKDQFVLSAELLTVLLSTVTFAAYMIIRLCFGKLDSLPVPVMISMFCDIIFVAIFNFWSQMERYYLRYKALVISSILIGLLSPSIAFILIRFSDEIGLYKGWARIISVVTLNGILGISLFIISLNRSKFVFTIKHWGYCIRYCIPLIPHFLAAAFLQKASQLFVDEYSGADASGIFSLASSLALMMMVFNDALTKTLVPWSYKKLSEKKYHEINKPILASLAMIGVLDLMMCMVAPEVVMIFADEKYADAIYAIPPLVGMCFFGFLYNAYTNIEYYYKETTYVSTASIIAGISIVVLEYLTVPSLGYLAAAYSSLASYCIYALMHYIFMNKTIDKHIAGEKIYNNKLIFLLSIVFVASILVMPILYKFSFVRYGVFVGIVIVLILNAKRIKELVLKLLDGKKRT